MIAPAAAAPYAPVAFPVRWDAPDGDGLHWALEPAHWPGPVGPLDGEFASWVMDAVSAALRRYGEPIAMRARRVNTYVYLAVAPGEGPPDPAGAARLQDAMDRLGELWAREWLPEIQEHLAAWEAIEPGALDQRALVEHLDETLDRLRRLWRVHFIAWFPFMGAMSAFVDEHRELLGEAGALDPYRMLAGLETKTLETARALWRLGRRAASDADVRDALAAGDEREALAAVRTRAAAWPFVAELDGFLARWGHSGVRDFPSTRSWIEDPTAVVKHLRDVLASDAVDPDAARAAMAADRDAAVAEARERLAGRPAAQRDRFERALASGQAGTVLSEDHSYWIDSRCMHRIRLVLLEVGQRAVGAGTLADAEDVFMLSTEELRVLARDPGARDRRALVADRWRERERFGRIAPPPELGVPPAGPPPDTAVGRLLVRFFGGPPTPPEHGRLVHGAPASSGRAQGTARVLASFAEAGRVRRGDVLVVRATTTPWTPLFGTVAGVVTDAGGVLCHAAVVAREYGIPAVVGTGCGTSAIRDGARVEVDGDAGIVRVLG
jgi:phosphohistidine swiveling domain-containing protein